MELSDSRETEKRKEMRERAQASHCGPEQSRNQTAVKGHSLVRSHRSLLRLLQTASFARALRCAHSFARSLTSLTPLLVGK